ncbi:MAG: polyprenol monophosphomannose synthase [Nitrososphaerota archaeon]|nr:polyprenol monophosphomannose synthase [Nitrososphaerota archaeon]MDG7023242.1 polyprenol monophosphomannose synthase [Nitrososphaerota archaeon]
MAVPSTTCIVIPTYNEKDNVEPLVRGIEGERIPGLKVLFVDDSSPDGTSEVIRSVAATRPWVEVLQRRGKQGIGSAYREGFRKALSDPGTEAVVEMDSDLQHPPAAIPDLLRALGQGADVAVGSRYVAGGGVPRWSLFRRWVSRGANAYARWVLGLEVRDATSGLRAYRRKAAEEIANADLPAKGYEFQVASLYCLKEDYRVTEVPFVFGSRAKGESKLGVADGLRFFVRVPRIAIRGRKKRRHGAR